MSTLVMLSDVAQLVMGQSPPSTSYNDVGDGLPFYQGKTDFGATYPTPRIYCRDPKKIAEAGDILMSVRAPVGATNLSNRRACIGRGIAAIRPHGIERDFLYFYLKKIETYIDSLGSGAIFKAINKSHLAELPINDAGIKLPEQKKIAHILSTVQRAIEEQERIIQITTELKKALMQKLFTEGLRNEPQKQTEIGPIPESWEVVAVGDVCRSIVPGRNKPKVFDGDIPWLTTPNIKGLDYINADVDGLRVTPDELKSSGGRLVPEKSVIMSCVGEFGVSAVTNIEIVINQQLHAFVCAANLNPVFLCNQLRYRKPYMERIAAITTIPYLNKSKCESVPTALPSREEQDEIAHCFETLDSKRNEHVRHKQALQDLFRTLLHELMTAKTRVHDLEIAA
jgi:type I restriction enzyme S subunit